MFTVMRARTSTTWHTAAQMFDCVVNVSEITWSLSLHVVSGTVTWKPKQPQLCSRRVFASTSEEAVARCGRSAACSRTADCERRDQRRQQNAAAASQAQSVEHRKLHLRSRGCGPTSRRQRFAAASSLEAVREYAVERPISRTKNKRRV